VEEPGADRFISINTTTFPETPENGARVQISYAGACYGQDDFKEIIEKLGRSSVRSPVQRSSSFVAVTKHIGYKEASFFAGFEISGVINRLGDNVKDNCGFKLGQAVIIYPYKGISNIYTEMFIVEDLKYLVPIPKSIPLSVACTIPIGGLTSLFVVSAICRISDPIGRRSANFKQIKILLIGIGGLSLWTLILLSHYLKDREYISIYIASSLDNELLLVGRDYPR
jgi:NADPH:quinone reductase-like Zn-dependent oxidoreductase